LMTGSGSTVFAVVKPGANREALADRARAEFDQKLWTLAAGTV
jgi:4-diphosphocytidyl-2C-methyl-D-erythritol kinase